MSCRLASIWVLALLTWAGPSAWAQIPISKDLIPSRNSLTRLGLERHWLIVVPLSETERLVCISRSEEAHQANLALLQLAGWRCSLPSTRPSERSADFGFPMAKEASPASCPRLLVPRPTRASGRLRQDALYLEAGV